MSGAVHEARRDQRLEARIVARRALVCAPDPRDPDRPAHVRAASGLAWWGPRLVAVQDDALWLALIDPRGGPCAALPLPAGPTGERLFDAGLGNKRRKPDLEGCFLGTDEGWLVGLGSGSTEHRRRWLVAPRGAEGEPGTPRWVDGQALYARLAADPQLSDGGLNLEGAARVGERLWLFQRGNGAPRAGGGPWDATCELPWAPLAAALASGGPLPALAPEAVRRWELGQLDGVRLSFTDAAPAPGGGVAFLAAAEDSPDAVDDGRVAGSALGVIRPGPLAVWSPLAIDGAPAVGIKAEGLALDPVDARRAWAVLDPDDPDRPAELLELALHGPWWG